MTSSKNERIHELYEHSAKYNEVYIKKLTLLNSM